MSDQPPTVQQALPTEPPGAIEPPAAAIAKARKPRHWRRWAAVIAFLGVIGSAMLWPGTFRIPEEWVSFAKQSAAALIPKKDEAKKEAATASLAPAVTVITAATSSVTEQVIVSGSLVPRTEVLVAPEIEGLAVLEILFDEGDSVKKGDVLVRLNRATLELQMAQNKAQVARANAAIAQSQTGITQAEATKVERDRSLQRTKSLREQGFATAAQLDQSVSAAKVSDALLKSSKKSVDVSVADKEALIALREDLEWRMARAEIRSPVTGKIVRKNARVGQIGSGQGEAMFRIIANGDIEMEADVADVSMPRLQEGLKVQVVLAGGRETINGEIRLIRPEIDQTTRMGKVRVRLPRDGRLIIGSSARGLIETGTVTGITVPLSAVSFGKTSGYVQVVSDGTVKTREIVLGLVGSDKVEVVSGLSAGETIVAKAGTFLKNGDKVRPMPLSQDTTRAVSQAAAP